jgi:hypothetical protein
MGWTTGVQFPAGARDFSLLHNIQNDSVDHPVSNPMGNGDCLSGLSLPGREADHLHLVPRAIMAEPFLLFPMRLHGVVLNYLNTEATFSF